MNASPIPTSTSVENSTSITTFAVPKMTSETHSFPSSSSALAALEIQVDTTKEGEPMTLYTIRMNNPPENRWAAKRTSESLKIILMTQGCSF
jgi:hypothetical protein